MSKTIKITEQRIRQLIRDLVNEQLTPGLTDISLHQTQQKQPAEDPFYIRFASGVEGEGVTSKKLSQTAMRFNIPNGDIWQLIKIK
jgi:hypothetical protein